MIRLSSFAKINLALELLGPRPDGFTEIRTIFQTIDLADELSIEEAPEGVIEVSCDEPSVPGGEENLAGRAARLLLEESGARRGARIGIRKRIPHGAGLGGGSGNAAVALVGLDGLWRTGLSAERRHRLAGRLGSDVPFFLYGGTALGLGRGEEVYPLPDARPACVLIAVPPFRIPTAEAYRLAGSQLTPRPGGHTIWRFSPLGLEGGAGYSFVVNELEPVAARQHTILPALRGRLLELGAEAASLCGSGSAVFGLFPAGDRGRGAAAEAAEKVEESFSGVKTFVCGTLDAGRYRAGLYRPEAAR